MNKELKIAKGNHFLLLLYSQKYNMLHYRMQIMLGLTIILSIKCEE